MYGVFQYSLLPLSLLNIVWPITSIADRMTLLTYTGLVLTLATIHEYVPYTPSLILSLILLRLVYKISRIILVLVYLALV